MKTVFMSSLFCPGNEEDECYFSLICLNLWTVGISRGSSQVSALSVSASLLASWLTNSDHLSFKV